MPEHANGQARDLAAAETSLAGDGLQYSQEVAHAPGVTVITDPAIVAAVERASELDRKWFARHRDRAHRVRRLMSGELPADPSRFGPVTWPVYVASGR
jgi:hypothetical protein